MWVTNLHDHGIRMYSAQHLTENTWVI